MKSDEAWERWGESDPYFGVLSVPQFRRANLDANRSAFFDSGVERIQSRLALAERLFGPSGRKRALDFGCGVGRLVIPLAQGFDEVIGVDVSPAMLAECARNLSERNLHNVDLVQSDDTLSRVEGLYDFVHSYIVLQHIPVRRGMGLIRRLLESVAPGGIVSIQFTTDRRDNFLQAGRYWMQRRLPGVQALTNLVRGRAIREPLVEMNEYSLPDVLDSFARLCSSEVHVNVEYQGRVRSVDLISQKSA